MNIGIKDLKEEIKNIMKIKLNLENELDSFMEKYDFSAKENKVLKNEQIKLIKLKENIENELFNMQKEYELTKNELLASNMQNGEAFNSLMNIKINEIENKYKQKFIEFEEREK